MVRSISNKSLKRDDALVAALHSLYVTSEQVLAEPREDWRKIQESVYQSVVKRSVDDEWLSRVPVPKLKQLVSVMRAALLKAVIPNQKFFTYTYTDPADRGLANTVKAYAREKIARTNLESIVNELINDYLLTGNAYVQTYYKTVTQTDIAGELHPYSGPEFRRIDPNSIIWDVSVPFQESWKMIKEYHHIGVLARRAEEYPDGDSLRKALSEIIKDQNKTKHMVQPSYSPGFDTPERIEVVTYLGDLWDVDTNELLKDQVIEIWGGSVVARKVADTELVNSYRHSALESVPGSYLGVSPLSQLRGMQDIVNVFTNGIADAMHLTVRPPWAIKNNIIDSIETIGPNEFVAVQDRDDITPIQISPNAAIAASGLVDKYLYLMEELAGAPKEAAGIKSPGEMSATQFQGITSASSRLFSVMAEKFEREIIEGMLNDAIIMTRKYGDTIDALKLVDERGVVNLSRFSRSDLGKSGRLRLTAAKNFAETQRRLNALIQALPLMQQLGVMPHVSGKQSALMIEELIGLEDFGLIKMFAGINEQAEVQGHSKTAADVNLEQALTDTGLA